MIVARLLCIQLQYVRLCPTWWLNQTINKIFGLTILSSEHWHSPAGLDHHSRDPGQTGPAGRCRCVRSWECSHFLSNSPQPQRPVWRICPAGRPVNNWERYKVELLKPQTGAESSGWWCWRQGHCRSSIWGPRRTGRAAGPGLRRESTTLGRPPGPGRRSRLSRTCRCPRRASRGPRPPPGRPWCWPSRPSPARPARPPGPGPRCRCPRSQPPPPGTWRSPCRTSAGGCPAGCPAGWSGCQRFPPGRRDRSQWTWTSQTTSHPSWDGKQWLPDHLYRLSFTWGDQRRNSVCCSTALPSQSVPSFQLWEKNIKTDIPLRLWFTPWEDRSAPPPGQRSTQSSLLSPPPRVSPPRPRERPQSRLSGREVAPPSRGCRRPRGSWCRASPGPRPAPADSPPLATDCNNQPQTFSHLSPLTSRLSFPQQSKRSWSQMDQSPNIFRYRNQK